MIALNAMKQFQTVKFAMPTICISCELSYYLA